MERVGRDDDVDDERKAALGCCCCCWMAWRAAEDADAVAACTGVERRGLRRMGRRVARERGIEFSILFVSFFLAWGVVGVEVGIVSVVGWWWESCFWWLKDAPEDCGGAAGMILERSAGNYWLVLCTWSRRYEHR